MKLKILNHEFFEYFKQCPTRAVFSFYMYDMLSDGKKSLVRDQSLEMYEAEILRKLYSFAVLTLTEKRELSFEDFKTNSLAILKKYLNKQATQNLERKNGLLTHKERIINDIEKNKLQGIYDSLYEYDFENAYKTFLKGYHELNKMVDRLNTNYMFVGRKYEFVRKYMYEYEIPLITEESGQYNIVIFTYSGIPAVNEEYDISLALTLYAARSLFPGLIFKKIIVYDMKTLKRKSFIVNEIQIYFVLANLYKMLIVCDTGMHYKAPGEHCKLCNNSASCYADLLNWGLFENIHENNLKFKKLKNHEKKSVIRKRVKEHSKKVSGKVVGLE